LIFGSIIGKKVGNPYVPGDSVRHFKRRLDKCFCICATIVLGDLPSKNIARSVVSRPGELHPQPLLERCRNLSAHTAPTRQMSQVILDSNARRVSDFSLKECAARCKPVCVFGGNVEIFALPMILTFG
jgi:hypothetical protein